MKKAAIISTLILMASCAFCAGAKRFGKMTDNDWVVTNAWQAMQHRVTPDSAWATNHFESSQFADAVNNVVIVPSTNGFVTAKAATNIAEYVVSTNGFIKTETDPTVYSKITNSVNSGYLCTSNAAAQMASAAEAGAKADAAAKFVPSTYQGEGAIPGISIGWQNPMIFSFGRIFVNSLFFQSTDSSGWGGYYNDRGESLKSALNAKANISELSTIAISGSYNDLKNRPTTLFGYGITDAYTKTKIDGTTVTNLGAVSAAVEIAKNYTDSKKPDEISKNGYHISADRTFYAQVSETNNFVTYNTTPEENAFVWGSASSTNFIYVGTFDGTGVWQNVFMDGDVAKTNKILMSWEKYHSMDLSQYYILDLFTVQTERVGTQEYTYQNLCYNPQKTERDSAIWIDNLSFYVVVTYTSGGTSVQKMSRLTCKDFFSSKASTKLATEDSVMTVGSTFAKKPNISRYNNSGHTIQECVNNNTRYEYTVIDRYSNYTNHFYTKEMYVLSNEVADTTSRWGTQNLTPVMGSLYSKDLIYIEDAVCAYNVEYCPPNTNIIERICMCLKYDKYGDFIGYISCSNPIVNMVSSINTNYVWVDIDEIRADEYLKIATDRAKAGDNSIIEMIRNCDSATNTSTKLRTVLNNDRMNFVVDKTASQSRLDLVNDTVLHLENANQIWVGGSADTNDEKKIVGAQTYMSIVDGVARYAADTGVASAMLTYSNRVDGVLNTYTNAINPRVNSAESKANAAIDACAVYSNQYEAVTNDNAMTRAVVYTWENFLDGSNVVFSITNYISGTYSLDTAKLKIMELRDGTNYVEVYNSHDEIALHMDYFKTNEFQRSMVAFSNSVNTAIAGKADKAWGKYTSTGEDVASVYASNTVWITEPTSVFAGGTEYKRFAVGEGSVCVLTTHGAPIYTQGEEGIFKFEDMGGTNYFGFAKTDSYEIGADASGISVQNQMVTITYDVTMSGVPCIWYKEAIESSDAWEKLNNPDGTAIPGVSHVVSWVQNPPEGKKICNINVTGEPNGFFRATIEVAGESKFITNMPADLGGGILCTDGQHKVKIDWNNGNPRFVEAQ